MTEGMSEPRDIKPGPHCGWDEDIKAARPLLELLEGEGMRLSSLQHIALSGDMTNDEFNRSRQALRNLGWATEARGSVIRLTDEGLKARRAD